MVPEIGQNRTSLDVLGLLGTFKTWGGSRDRTSWDILDTPGTFETWDMCSGTRDRTK